MGEIGLYDRPSTSENQPTATATDPAIADRIEPLRRTHKWSAHRITFELESQVSVRAVTWILTRRGLNRRTFLDPTGQVNRRPGRITARWPGHMMHIDIKKVGRIPAGGSWRIHGKNAARSRAAGRAKATAGRPGYVYLHSAIYGFTRLSFTESLGDKRGPTAAEFWHRARAFFAAHGITRVNRVITDNGSLDRSRGFAHALKAGRHQFTAPYIPRHTGKIKRYNRTLAEELLYARPYSCEAARTQAIRVWNIHYS